MRLLQVVPSLGAGGAEHIMSHLAEGFHRRGHNVLVASLFGRKGTNLESRLAEAGIPVEYLDKQPGLDVRMVPRLQRILRRYRPHIMHTHGYVLRYAWPAALFAPRCGIAHTVHSLAEREADTPGRVLQHVAFRGRVRPVAIGTAVARSIERVYGIKVRFTVPNGIPVAEYRSTSLARNGLRLEVGIAEDAPVFACVGRFRPEKNHRALLRAFASGRLKDIGAQLLLAGDGELLEEMRCMAVQLGLVGRIHFLGVRRDIPRILAASDALVLPSLWEGNPLSVMEAMAAGRPVVAFAVGCVPELVDSATGILVPPGDDSALEDAMFTVASDLDHASRLGAAALQRASDHFDVSTMCAGYESVYERLLSSAPA